MDLLFSFAPSLAKIAAALSALAGTTEPRLKRIPVAPVGSPTYTRITTVDPALHIDDHSGNRPGAKCFKRSK